jgi:uncharacterized protein (DUF58 family)
VSPDSNTATRTSPTRGAVAGETVTRLADERLGVGAAVSTALRRGLGRAAGTARLVGAWFGETVTPAGWLLVGVLVVGVAAWLAFGLVEMAVVAVVAAVLLLTSIPFLLIAAGLAVRLELDRDRVVAGSEVGAQLHIRNASARLSPPGVLDVPVGDGLVEAEIPLLLRSAEHVQPLRIVAPRRGVITVGPMTIARGDPIGVLRREVSWPQVERIHVHPVTVPIPSTSAGTVRDVDGVATTRIVDEDLEFHGFREYVPGDSMRHVHWKSTAKADRLMVRQYEETRRASIAVLLDVRSDGFGDGEAGDAAFELAVSAAASLAAQGLRDGREVRFVADAGVGERGRRRTTSITSLPTHHRTALLDATCLLERHADAQRLDEVARLAAETYPTITLAFSVTGRAIELDRIRRTAFALPLGARSATVRCDPGAEPTLRSTGGITIITIGRLDDLGRLIARGALS